MNNEIYSACDRLLSAAANGVYQGIIIALVAGLCLRFFGRTNAATRHAVWFATLLLLAGLIPAHLFIAPPGTRLAATGTQAAQTADDGAWAKGLGADSDLRLDAESAPSRETGAELDSERLAETESQGGAGNNTADATLRDESASSEQSAHSPSSSTSGFVSNLRAGFERWTERFTPVSWDLATRLNLPATFGFWVVALWLAAVGVRLGLLSARLGKLRQLKRNSTAASADLEKLFQSLKAECGVKREVQLRFSAATRSAAVLGFLHPVVLLPTKDTPPLRDDVEHILRHELAHVQRRDDWANLAQQAIRSVLFFDPAIWWISRQLSLEREIACDDHVLQQRGGPRTYALILANLASRMKHPAPLLAPGVSASKTQLHKRISMILNTRRNSSPRLVKSRLGIVTSAAAVLAVLALNAGPRLILAQTAPTPPVAPAAPAAGVTITAAPAAAPQAPALAFADTPGEATPRSDSAPKYKAEPGDDYPPQPAPPATPALPRRPGRTPAPSMNLDAPTPPPGPGQPPRAIRLQRIERSGMSVEERLDRVERMLRTLMARQDRPNAGNPDELLGMPGKQDQARVEREEARRMSEDARRMSEEAKRKMKDFERQWDGQEQRSKAVAGKVRVEQLDALKHARESLEREMRNLDRQIERLEQDRQQDQKPQPRKMDEKTKEKEIESDKPAK